VRILLKLHGVAQPSLCFVSRPLWGVVSRDKPERVCKNQSPNPQTKAKNCTKLTNYVSSKIALMECEFQTYQVAKRTLN